MATEEERRAEAKAFQRINDAFRTGDLEALRAAVDDPAVVPNGRMPITIGSCLVYAIYHSPLAFIRTLLEVGADPNPEDHAAMMAARQGAAFDGAVQVVADPLVGRGGCLVKSAFGTVDAGIDTQVREMSHALLGEDAEDEMKAKANGVPTTA